MKKHRILSGVLTGSLVLSFLVVPVNAASLTDQLAESNAKQAEAQFQVDMTQNTIDGIEAESEKVNEEIDRINGVIDGINTEIAELEARIEKTQQELQIAEAKKAEQEDEMSDRVRTLYMYGNDSILEFLFSATDFSDFITKLDMSRYIVSADKDILEALNETQIEIDNKKASIEADRLKTVEKRSEQEVALQEQESVKAQKDQLIAQNQVVLDEYTAILESEVATGAAIEGQLAAYYAEQEQQAQAAQEAADQAAANDGTGSSDSGNDTSSGDSSAGSSSDVVYSSGYVWPCDGSITSPFGWRTHPIYGDQRFHSGVDIGASSGTAVASAGNGTVISAGWNGGYGNCIIVDLGNGVSAVYAHLSAMYVSSGQTVSAGQTVGAVGSTGDSTGPHLHFEMRLYGSAVSPYNYF
ncbi:peptidoglycan DD-metalloendopeptidase family protein [Eubacteriaceae bacterium ES2]|nr:peptidoglycan DD-metalloendopeptidase family protein [Eubacteriaceae bacterium ES2]